MGGGRSLARRPPPGHTRRASLSSEGALAFVADASALVWGCTELEESARAVRFRFLGEAVHAPHLIDAEFGDVLRRKVLRGELALEEANTLLWAGPHLVDVRYEGSGRLAAAAWELRENVTFYDGLYVALAGALALPLVTADSRLAEAPDLPCRIDLVQET